jgi:hypothetical protein
MSDYAPGPWEYNDPKNFHQVHGKFSDVAVYAAGNAFPWRMAEIQGPRDERTIATAKLIAAAPDMLEALKAFIGAIDRAIADDDVSIVDEITDEIEDAARAAIAKAEGSAP